MPRPHRCASKLAHPTLLGQIFRGCWPFVLVMILNLGLPIAFPQISLWLPSLMQ